MQKFRNFRAGCHAAQKLSRIARQSKAVASFERKLGQVIRGDSADNL
jgi:hypothetical protein